MVDRAVEQVPRRSIAESENQAARLVGIATMSDVRSCEQVVPAHAVAAGIPAADPRHEDGAGRRCTSADLVGFAKRVSAAGDIRAARQAVVGLTADLLGIPWVALTKHGLPREVSFVASSDDVVRSVARIAAATREGLCWQLYRDDVESVISHDLHAEPRWPNFRQVILAELPIRSGLGLPVRTPNGPMEGGLILYSDQPGCFEGPRLADAVMLSEHAGIALAHVMSRAKADNLEVALRSSREIGMSIGIIMDRHRVTEEQAFEILRAASQDRRIKLRELANRVVLTGEVPLPRPTAASQPASPTQQE